VLGFFIEELSSTVHLDFSSACKPKGLMHTTGGYLVHAYTTFKYIFDWNEGDVYACMADIGWITYSPDSFPFQLLFFIYISQLSLMPSGHTYIVYGPLSNGASTFLFDSVPLYPNPSRYWDMVDR
jgi:acetyl-CoA synthetase